MQQQSNSLGATAIYYQRTIPTLDPSQEVYYILYKTRIVIKCSFCWLILIVLVTSLDSGCIFLYTYGVVLVYCFHLLWLLISFQVEIILSKRKGKS